ncbi:sensor histidine kinase [Longispora sp. K20-0274]|uniref:sensor histidine kinase n=1 Tax=Longispora sp. K20-0274 TaxID=3088255 RepID=UPI00399BFDB5
MRSWMHAGFYLLLAASASRYVARHGLTGEAPLVLGLAGALAIGYSVWVLWPRTPWFAGMLAGWLVLVLLAPSFAWCAVPLLFVALGQLSTRAAVPVAAGLTAAVVLAQLRLADRFDPSLVLAPVAVATIATAAYLRLARTSEALAVSERRAGVLDERQRLAREIHDTLAQGLSSMNLLLQAADRDWATAPDTARDHVRRASAVARENLVEARRVVADLAPAALHEQSLVAALRQLCATGWTGAAGGLSEARAAGGSIGSGTPDGPAEARAASGPPGARSGPATACELTTEGEPYPLGGDVDVALFRVAQGALANVAEHARATRVAVTLTYLPDCVTLDVRDDGIGFDPGAVRPTAGRGYGLDGIRRRVALLGGTVEVESTPGAGTALAVTVPTAGAA